MSKYPLAILAFGLFFLSASPPAAAYEDRALIMYDTAAQDARHRANDDVLRNLLGHFDLPHKRQPVHRYRKGQISKHKVTFYIGNTIGHQLPKSFLRDVLYSQRPVVWINFNLAQLGMSKEYKRQFEKRFGFRYVGHLAKNSYEHVWFRKQTLPRNQEWIGKTKVLDDDKTQVFGLAITADRSRFFPYIVKANNFTYVADNPMDVWYEDQAYLAFAEVLHTILNRPHRRNPQALVRLEDVAPNDNPAKLKVIADYLRSQGVPFGVSVVPRFTDPLGAYGPAQTIDLDEAPEIVDALNYIRGRGGTLLMHGFTHQYGTVPNPLNGVTGVDSEFWISGGPLPVGPVPEDSVAWAQGRIDKGAAIFAAAGFSKPRIWVTPHYTASQLDYRVFASNFRTFNLRFENAYFPYVINRSVYGPKIIPENLGRVNPNTRPARVVVALAEKNLVVRDGWASFFFHPEVDINHLKTAIGGIKGLGYSFVDIKTL